MYVTLRLSICIAIGILGFLLVLKRTKRLPSRKAYLTIIISDILLVTVLSLIPVENLFYTFKTPEDAFRYYNSDVNRIELVVEGEQSDFVVGIKNNTSTILALPKTKDGWKTGTGLQLKTAAWEVSDDIMVSIYHSRGTSDFFVSIRRTNGGELTISDEYDTEFLPLSENKNSYASYYGHVANLDSQYRVTVNGKEIVLNIQ